MALPASASVLVAGKFMVLPALLVLALQAALYLWMAPRGFDFSDESYYLHNYLHWREFTGTVTFFGAYFEWPFRILRADIGSMRVLTLVLVLGSAAILMRQLMRFAFGNRIPTSGTLGAYWYAVVPMGTAMLFFGHLTTLRLPSYNVLCLASIAMMTVSMLSVIERRRDGGKVSGMAFLYGLTLGMCFLSKATTAVLVTMLHAVFFCSVNRDWNKKGLLRIVALVTLGFALNFAVLTLALPHWYAVLREGMVVAGLRDETYSFKTALISFRWQLQNQLTLQGPWMIGAVLILVIAGKKIAAAPRGIVSLLILALVLLAPYSHFYEQRSRIWLLAAAVVVGGLWLIEFFVRRGAAARYDERAELALMVLLLLSPLAFSFGTNMPVLSHSAIAALFAYAAICLRLYRLADAGVLTAPVMTIALAALCLPALMVQYRALTDVRHTYRQAAPLMSQNMPTVLGTNGSLVHVDSLTNASLENMKKAARQAGMPAGQDVLDLTGDGPGVTYVIGARPVGSPWMLGGYPGSEASIERVVQKVDAGRIRNAWLLTSIDNRLRVRDWRGLLERRIGRDTHQLAASIAILNPYWGSKGAPPTVNLQLWKPVPSREDGIATAELKR